MSEGPAPRTDKYAVNIETAKACIDIDLWVPYQFCRDLERELLDIYAGMLCYKEVLIGAEFEKISELPSKGIEFCHAVGKRAKERIKDILEENRQLKAEMKRMEAGLR